jgi:hypothetical protein
MTHEVVPGFLPAHHNLISAFCNELPLEMFSTFWGEVEFTFHGKPIFNMPEYYDILCAPALGAIP